MRYLFHLQIDFESRGNNGTILRETVSKLKQVISLLEGSRNIHRGGVADDTSFVDYWYTVQPTLEINESKSLDRDLVRHRWDGHDCTVPNAGFVPSGVGSHPSQPD